MQELDINSVEELTLEITAEITDDIYGGKKGPIGSVTQSGCCLPR